MKVKKGDTVLVIAGQYRKRQGKVLRTFPKEGKVLVEGVNIVKKHRKPKKEGEKGQIVQIPLPMDASNVMVVCPKCKKATRIGYKFITEKGKRKKVRFCKKCGQII